MPDRTHPKLPRRTSPVPAVLRLYLGRALTLLAAIVCVLVLRPEQTAVSCVRLALADHWAAPPISPNEQDEPVLVDSDVDFDDDESATSSDPAAVWCLPAVFACHVDTDGRLQRAPASHVLVARSRLAMGPRLARGPPASRRSLAL